MSRIGKIARRTFLFGAVAVTGGAAFGYYKLTQDPENPLGPLVPPQGATLNPWLMIDPNGITIIAPRAEMGQGVHTTLPALVAEELDAAWEDITVLHGPPAKAYFNQALLGGAFPVADYKRKPWQDNAAMFLGNAAKFLDMQVTGGSTSTRDAYDKMRQAGANAREMLKSAAAARLGVSVADLKTEASHVIAPDGTRIPYADLATEAARIDPPKVALRTPSEWKLLGRDLPRTDMVGKSTGTATYGVDVRLPGQLFATVRMSPKRGAMLRFDASVAAQMPGVSQVVDLGNGVAVVARNTWLAIQAAETIDITWADAAYPADTDSQFAVIAAAFGTEPNATPRDDGDVTAVNGTEITAEYRVPFLPHATMEPMTTTALYTADGLELWSPNQAPVMVRDHCAEAVGLTPEQVTVHTTLMGGGFGRRGEYDFAVIAARVAQQVAGTPVQVTWSREEDMRHDFYRPAAIARMRGVVDQGKALALEGRVASPSASHQALGRWMGRNMDGPDTELIAGMHDQPYAIPNMRVSGYIADLAVPVGFWRSVGASYNGFFMESFVDEMAHAAGRDPMEFRLELLRAEHAPSAAVLEAVAAMSNWIEKPGPGRGRGVAFTYSFGTPVAQVVEVAQTDQGIRIDKVWIACDPGVALDPRNITAQMMGGAIYGLSAACYQEITFADGEVEQWNFPDVESIRMGSAPQVDVRFLQNASGISGVGEPGTPPAAPALANALFDLTGRRATQLPLIKEFPELL